VPHLHLVPDLEDCLEISLLALPSSTENLDSDGTVGTGKFDFGPFQSRYFGRMDFCPPSALR